MKSGEFINRLNAALAQLPPEERAAAVSYYEEYFSDAADDERAVIKLGSPESVAESILKEYGVAPQKAETRQTSKNSKTSTNILLIILAVLASPIWLPVLVAVVVTVFSLAIACVAVLAALAVSGFGVFIGGICLIVVGIAAMIRLSVADGLFLLGSGLVLCAIGAILCLVMFWAMIKATPPIVNGLVNLCKKPFKKKEVR